jgi:hypothetical protein
MTNINVIDDFLSIDQFKFMQSKLAELPWMYTDRVSSPDDTQVSCDDIYDWQMVHIFYDHPFRISEHMNLIQPLLDRIHPVALYRAKLNLNPVTSEIVEHGYHSDYDHEEYGKHFTSAVYYFNTNDGYTKFENGDTVTSVENRLVTFPSTMKHTGSTCTNTKNRQVLNLMFIEGDPVA